MSIIYPIRLDILTLLISLSEATDTVSPALVNHHKQVSHIAYSIGKTMGLDDDDLRDLTTAAAIHDIGGLSLASRLETLDFEMRNPKDHSFSGAVLLSVFKPFGRIAELVRFHHVDWEEGSGEVHGSAPVPRLAHVLHLADRIAVLIDRNKEILKQVVPIVAQIRENTGRMFVPEMVQAFEELAVKESFWFGVADPQRCRIFSEESVFGSTEMAEQELLDLTSLLCRIIDFRSRFTATHSSGVSAVGEALAEKIQMDASKCRLIKMAGLLHDIGKLVVPREILEKETPLISNDFIVIRRHPYYSQRILESVPGFETICTWSAYHHERLDGSGYPFHVKGEEIPLGAQLLSVVDTFTALTEVRPYRASTSARGALKLLEFQANKKKLNGDFVAHFSRHVDEFDAIREAAQSEASGSHAKFVEELQGI